MTAPLSAEALAEIRARLLPVLDNAVERGALTVDEGWVVLNALDAHPAPPATVVEGCELCHGDFGWTGLHGAWEPCPNCDPTPTPPEPQSAPEDVRLSDLLLRLLTDEYGEEAWTDLGSLRRIVSAIESSAWLATEREAGERAGEARALAEVQALADEGYQGAVMSNLRYADGFYAGWAAFIVVLKDRLSERADRETP